ncbi:SDR family oxidoreductase [Aldersonia kunmingensis]|uniref:SDR family oxidoreductase n=1 Tax=Aldersonia kunmingensis TaxID=408066 RepID=UPI00082DAAD9|nr:SDR family oxidoreductase [Aldersonia kunmingensis]
MPAKRTSLVRRDHSQVRCLVTGATGYVGGRLAPRLVAAGHQVRVLARTPEKLRDVPWAADVEVVPGDLSDLDSLRAACKDVDVVYYLVHSMSSDADFAATERRSAANVARAAEEAKVCRIVYLGGLHPGQGELSEHLASRAEVGNILLDSDVPAMVLQAGPVIGSGSASFEMIRHLANRLPVMTTPKWVRNRIQPIAVRDVLHYLVACATLDYSPNRTFDIGGPDVITYADMMKEYAEVAGLSRRRILALPVLTPRLASLWVGLVTPLPPRLARPLIESVQCDAIAYERDIDVLIPPPAEGLTSYRNAVQLALRRMSDNEIETHWANATVPSIPSDPLPSDPDWAGETVYTDIRSRDCAASPDMVWDVVESIGGENGWYSFPLAWSVRGWIDRMAGGVGARRGRRDPRRLNTGEALDFWRVERLDRPNLLRLRAEMRVPGRAWLEFRVAALPDGRTRIDQRAVFFPRGLAGRSYWYSVLPFHGIVFRGMLENIASKAERMGTRPAPEVPAAAS